MLVALSLTDHVTDEMSVASEHFDGQIAQLRDIGDAVAGGDVSATQVEAWHTAAVAVRSALLVLNAKIDALVLQEYWDAMVSDLD